MGRFSCARLGAGYSEDLRWIKGYWNDDVAESAMLVGGVLRRICKMCSPDTGSAPRFLAS